MQMKLYLIGQGIFHFVDGSLLCSPSYVIVVDGYSLQTNPFFLRWKQKDQLILSALLSYLSMDVLHFVVNYETSHCIFYTLEQALFSPCNSYIMQLHGSSQDIHQGDVSVPTHTHTHTHTQRRQKNYLIN